MAAEIAGVVGVASMSLQQTQLKTFSENLSSPGGRLLINKTRPDPPGIDFIFLNLIVLN